MICKNHLPMYTQKGTAENMLDRKDEKRLKAI